MLEMNELLKGGDRRLRSLGGKAGGGMLNAAMLLDLGWPWLLGTGKWRCSRTVNARGLWAVAVILMLLIVCAATTRDDGATVYLGRSSAGSAQQQRRQAGATANCPAPPRASTKLPRVCQSFRAPEL